MFSDNLSSLRKIHNLSQEELAERIGVSRQSLSKYETGESIPDIEKCVAIANVLNVSLDDLVNYDRETFLGLEAPPRGKHMFGMVKVGENGEIVIPEEARRIFKIAVGDNVFILGDEMQGLAIVKESSLQEMVEMINRMKR